MLNSISNSDFKGNRQSGDLKACPICIGSGKVITGYGVICTELVEKVEKCHECKGKGYLD